MLFINAVSVAPVVREWLENSLSVRVLHVFDRACNLIDERGDVLSIVTSQIGNGPFNLVIEEEISLSEYLSRESAISITKDRLYLGALTINIANAEDWNPRPNWENLHARRNEILSQLAYFPSLSYQFPNSLCASLADAKLESSISAARQLAGLGIGLTPAGDDFILGALLAAWIIHSPHVAGMLAKEVAGIAAPLTTSLSAAWLRSTGKGEAGISWHEFFEALLSNNGMAIQGTLGRLLAVGHTSGADALAGFTTTFIAYAKRETTLCPS